MSFSIVRFQIYTLVYFVQKIELCNIMYTKYIEANPHVDTDSSRGVGNGLDRVDPTRRYHAILCVHYNALKLLVENEAL